MTSPLQSILSSIATLANGDLLGMFGKMAAIGAISMAIVQICKELTPLRTRWQRAWVVDWLHKYDNDPDEQVNIFAGRTGTSNNTSLADELADITAGGEAECLYEQAGEELTQCVLRAAPILLDEPDRYPKLLNRLMWGVAPADKAVLAAGPVRPIDANVYFDARARALRRIERNLDGVALVLTSKWRFWMQSFAITATVIMIWISLAIAGQLSALNILLAVPVGVVGGYFAPITKDILSTLQQLALKK